MNSFNRKERKAFLSEMGNTAFWNRTPRSSVKNAEDAECKNEPESGNEETKQVHLSLDQNALEAK